MFTLQKHLNHSDKQAVPSNQRKLLDLCLCYTQKKGFNLFQVILLKLLKDLKSCLEKKTYLMMNTVKKKLRDELY